MTPLISVVITTHNRAELLKNCLNSLVDQTLDHTQFEIIVVDNCSNDTTREVVDSFKETGMIRYFYEAELGMNSARNLGLKQALCKYVAYIDDDAKAEANWLEVAADTYASVTPIPDCLGGPILPFYTSTKPEWFKDQYEIRRNWPAPRYLKTGESFSGSNMIWKKETLETLNGFDPGHGVIGNTLRLGGETIVFSKIWADFENPQLYFSPDLIIYHWVPSFKMTMGYRLKRAFAVGQTMGRIELEKLKWLYRIRHFFSYGIKVLINIIRAIVHVTRHRKIQNWIVEEIGSVLLELGKSLALANIFIKMEQKT